jgi:hypothetical protein
MQKKKIQFKIREKNPFEIQHRYFVTNPNALKFPKNREKKVDTYQSSLVIEYGCRNPQLIFRAATRYYEAHFHLAVFFHFPGCTDITNS